MNIFMFLHQSVNIFTISKHHQKQLGSDVIKNQGLFHAWTEAWAQ